MRRITVCLIMAMVAMSLATGTAPAAAGTATEIVVLGGSSAVDDAIVEHLETCTSQPVRRIAGSTRYHTAAAISADAFVSSEIVFVATAGDFPDAVAAGSPASLFGAPVLLTDRHSLPSATRAEIERLGATTIFVLGGPSAISQDVAIELAAYGAVTRLSGANRYETAAAVSRIAFATADTVYVATGVGFADALAGAPAAAVAGSPILLVTRTSIPDATRTELDRLDPTTTVVLGGTGVVSDAVAAQLPGTVVRLAGSNRFGTAAAVSAASFTPGSTPVVYVTTGLAAPDALAGGPVAGFNGGPILLTTRTVLPAVTATEIARLTGLPCAPYEAPADGHRTGLEPGTILAGQVLPLDWSARPPVCGATQENRLLAVDPALCPGDRSSAVADLQRLLTEKQLYRGPISGHFDESTRFAVVTFHKLMGPAHRTPATARAEWIADPPPEDWDATDWLLLRAFAPQPPKHRSQQPNRVEVDIGRQVLYLIEQDAVSAIIPVSTGSGTGVRGCTWVGCGAFVTPRTDRIDGGAPFYTKHDYAGGWSPRPGGWSIYKAIFYRGNYGEWNYGIHGYGSVPSYPDSHGCIRVTTWDMDFLRPDNAPDRVRLGQIIHVWDA